ncbi:MAG: hypothetical protein L6R36_004340 [Xanthoria steineri]|nr:MAG: hypothetical protein L6R36_004340 [Xanthoria steineri]
MWETGCGIKDLILRILRCGKSSPRRETSPPPLPPSRPIMKASTPKPAPATSGIWAGLDHNSPQDLDRMGMGARIRYLQGNNPSQRRRRLRHITEERGSSADSTPPLISSKPHPPISLSLAWVAQSDW